MSLIKSYRQVSHTTAMMALDVGFSAWHAKEGDQDLREATKEQYEHLFKKGVHVSYMYKDHIWFIDETELPAVEAALALDGRTLDEPKPKPKADGTLRGTPKRKRRKGLDLHEQTVIQPNHG